MSSASNNAVDLYSTASRVTQPSRLWIDFLKHLLLYPQTGNSTFFRLMRETNLVAYFASIYTNIKVSWKKFRSVIFLEVVFSSTFQQKAWYPWVPFGKGVFCMLIMTEFRGIMSPIGNSVYEESWKNRTSNEDQTLPTRLPGNDLNSQMTSDQSPVYVSSMYFRRAFKWE